VKAGIMTGGEGLQPTSKGARVVFSGDRRTVVEGPFAASERLVCGFWLWKCKSKAEAIEWAKRCPNPMPGEESELEIRQIFEAADFGAEFTPELREQEERLRAEIAAKQGKSEKDRGVHEGLPHLDEVTRKAVDTFPDGNIIFGVIR